MKAIDFKNIVSENDSNLLKYAISEFGSWDEFVISCFLDGNIFTLPSNCLVPRSANEWEHAKENNSFSNDKIIEVELKGVDMLVISDGHNRYKDVLKNNIDFVKVKFVK